MPKLTLALLFAAGALISGCKSNETKPADPAPAPAAAASAPVTSEPPRGSVWIWPSGSAP